jgi:hypothetical protein
LAGGVAFDGINHQDGLPVLFLIPHIRDDEMMTIGNDYGYIAGLDTGTP